jgi:glycerol uptake facilitator-like aquaporin
LFVGFIGERTTMSRELQNPSSASEGLLDKRETEEYAPLGHNTKELQAARHQAFLRAIYAEFTGTFIFFSMILGPIAKCYLAGVDPTLAAIICTLAAGLSLVSVIMCFSSLSGAQLNPAITIALWACRKISNRKCAAFVLAQLSASIVVMLCIYGAFPDVHHELLKALSVQAPEAASLGNIFFSEFLATFILTYVAFSMAFEEAESLKSATMSLTAMEETDGLLMYSSTPQSKVGFAPFAIGFILIGLAFYGGGSGICMNPARLFGPALFSGVWDKWYMYFLGEIVGAIAAGLLVDFGPQSGQRENSMTERISTIPANVRDSMKRMSSTVQKGVTSIRNATVGEI